MSEGDVTGDELSLLDKSRGTLSKALGLYLTSKAIYATGKQAYVWAQNKRTYSITVAGNDMVYPFLHDWILDRLPDERRRSLTAESEYEYGTAVNEYGDALTTSAKIRLRYDGARVHKLDVDGYQVEVSVGQRDDMPKESHLVGRHREKIYIRAKSREGRDAVVALLNKLVEGAVKGNRTPKVNMVARWGDWQPRSDLPVRPIESVILRDGQREALVADFEDFLESERFYNERAMPWHRGYLFYGPPGTGKTSAAKAIAAHLGLDLYYMSLGDSKSDHDIMGLITSVPARSILLLEDIDVFHVATSRDESKDTPSLSSLLNALDGVTTPHGIITIMTTNDISVLDEALIRPGRVDRKEYFDVADNDQGERIFEWFYGQKPNNRLIRDGHGIAPAELLDIMHANKHDAECAVRQIRKSPLLTGGI
jgi:hypothetical protein